MKGLEDTKIEEAKFIELFNSWASIYADLDHWTSIYSDLEYTKVHGAEVE